MNIVPSGAVAFLFSSDGTYPLPFSIVNSISKFTDLSRLQITKSGLRTWNDARFLPISPAVN